MNDFVVVLSLLGAFCFGLVIGWVTYRTLRFSTVSGLSDIATVIGAIGGAAITALFQKESGAFGLYCIGLALGFFLYLRTARDPTAPSWMGGEVSRDSGLHAEGNIGSTSNRVDGRNERDGSNRDSGSDDEAGLPGVIEG